MATSVVFALVDELVSQLRTAMPTVNVYDGTGNTDDPGDFLMIGVSDPDTDRPQVFESQQSWAGLGASARDEIGKVACVAGSWNGDFDNAQARAGVATVTAGVENYLRAHPDLDGAVTGLMWTGYGTDASAELIEAEDGIALLWRFDIAYKARI